MKKEKEKTIDEKAPAMLVLNIVDGNGKSWGQLFAPAKQFSTGSTGFYANGKLINPDNPIARYQVSGNFILIGSK